MTRLLRSIKFTIMSGIILLFSFTFIPFPDAHAQSNAVNTVNITSSSLTIDQLVQTRSLPGNSTFLSIFKTTDLKVPAPVIYPYRNSTNLIIDQYQFIPDGFAGNPQLFTESDFIKTSGSATKRSNTECMVGLNVSLRQLAELNSGNKSLVSVDPQYNKPVFNSLLTYDHDKTFVSIVFYFTKDVKDGKTSTTIGGRRIVGSDSLKQYNVFPSFLTDSRVFECYSPVAKGVTFSSSDFTTQKSLPANINRSGVLYGEFLQTTVYGDVVCNLSGNPLFSTDIFGNKAIGVNTALGCLPGTLNGVFSVILRIAIGISSAILMILILTNSLTIMTNNGDPNKVKEAISNITKAAVAFILIVFSVFILNIAGLKIIPLSDLGDTSLQQLTN